MDSESSDDNLAERMPLKKGHAAQREHVPLSKRRKAPANVIDLESSDDDLQDSRPLKISKTVNPKDVPLSQRRKASKDETPSQPRKEPKKPPTAKSTSDAPSATTGELDWAALISSNEIRSLKVPQLKSYLKSAKIPLGGEKDALVERIVCHWESRAFRVEGKQPWELKLAELRKALAVRGLSPMSDSAQEQDDLVRRLTDYLKTHEGGEATNAAEEKVSEGEAGQGNGPAAGEGAKSSVAGAIAIAKQVLALAAVMDWEGILSVLGEPITPASTTGAMRKQYMKISLQIHPDKLSRDFPEATKAFQALVMAFDRLSQPELYPEEVSEGRGKKGKKAKIVKIQRSNEGCHKTKLFCPRCRCQWGQAVTGVQPYFYNFMMQGLKSYTCATCLLEFGCVTAVHKCPFCTRDFDYDPADFHRKVRCGNAKCEKEFGFFEHHVPERIEKALREELREVQEKRMKERENRERRARRARESNLSVSTVGEGKQVEEGAFARGLVDVCPRCGAEGFSDAAEQKLHLSRCNDRVAIQAYKKKQEQERAQASQADAEKSKQLEMENLRHWEMLGGQTSDLWRLEEGSLRRLCADKGVECPAGSTKMDMVQTLASHLNKQKAGLLLTSGEEGEAEAGAATQPPLSRDSLPSNLYNLSVEQLQIVCISNGIELKKKRPAKKDIIEAIEAALFRGTEDAVLLLE
ncbi:hypothetical protein CYMTET_53066 [Cymbomonas tetramitiformis]|uniref:J domain-containing protein n=1 Tax=Cymbomonas tetramitiformis TaxID=36881 RepID=A0AAE0BJJ8_9CHLO|nr:hypothetical protein CYMTET_53066 [Cymbomonas tetramitiformis]